MLKRDLLRHEFIGLDVEVIKAKNQSLIGIQGKIIDETKNTFTIKGKTTKKILKAQVTLLIKMKQPMIIEGTSLLNRSEDRLKK